jgi:hypothetical protein
VTDGPHSFTATQSMNGVTSTAPAQSFMVMGADPLVVTTPAPGATYLAGADGTGTVLVKGTAQPGAIVTVTLDDGTVATATVADDGTWSARFTGVKQGQHTYTATQSIGAYTSSPVTVAFSVIRDPAVGGGTGGGGTDPGNGGGTGNGGTGNGGTGGGAGTGNGGTGSGSGQGTTSPAGNGGTIDPGTSVVSGVLAFTGSTVLPWAVVGAGILALGLGMLGASRGLSRIRARKR